jgi:hypothetical protein
MFYKLLLSLFALISLSNANHVIDLKTKISKLSINDLNYKQLYVASTNHLYKLEIGKKKTNLNIKKSYDSIAKRIL